MRCTGPIIGLLLAPWFLIAQQNPQQMATHKYPADHIAVLVPTEWVEIPKTELDQISANLQEAAPNAKPQPYNYGFQASAASAYPRVLIQVKTGGRWSENVFSQMTKLPAMKDEIQREMGSISSAFAALSLQIGKLTYDPKKRMVWLRMQFRDANDQAVEGLSGLHPTNVGSIQVHCYAAAADFERYAPIFSDIITSVQVDDEWKYRERSALSRSIGGVADLVVPSLTAAVGGIVAFVVLRVLRRRKMEGKAAYRRR